MKKCSKCGNIYDASIDKCVYCGNKNFVDYSENVAKQANQNLKVPGIATALYAVTVVICICSAILILVILSNAFDAADYDAAMKSAGISCATIGASTFFVSLIFGSLRWIIIHQSKIERRLGM